MYIRYWSLGYIRHKLLENLLTSTLLGAWTSYHLLARVTLYPLLEALGLDSLKAGAVLLTDLGWGCTAWRLGTYSMEAALGRGCIMMMDSTLCHLLAGSTISRDIMVMVPSLDKAMLLVSGRTNWLGLLYRSTLVWGMMPDRLGSS